MEFFFSITQRLINYINFAAVFRSFCWPFFAWRRNISLMSGTFISGFDHFFFFLSNDRDFCVRTGKSCKMIAKKEARFRHL